MQRDTGVASVPKVHRTLLKSPYYNVVMRPFSLPANHRTSAHTVGSISDGIWCTAGRCRHHPGRPRQ